MKDWSKYFEHNRKHRREIPWEQGVHVPAPLRSDLIRSLQRFQLGESGDGFFLRRNASGQPMAYREALDFFIAEEQEHARLMGEVLDRMNAPRLRWHWSDWAFERVRRLLGLRLEVMVLLVAEMIAKRYFRALAEGVDDAVVRKVAGQIGHDEEGHLAFQVDYLRDTFAKWPFLARVGICAGWRLMFRAACLVVWWDHGALLRQCGVRPEGFWWDCGLIFDEVSAGVFGGAEYPLADASPVHAG